MHCIQYVMWHQKHFFLKRIIKASLSICRGMFAGGLREMEQQEVQIQGVSYNAMCKILNFIYTSELELSVDNVQEILAASCQLQVRAGGSKDVLGVEHKKDFLKAGTKTYYQLGVRQI